ncbi:MAG: hypothetical protein J6Z31_08600 [Fibrobacter sp.]|nr:hypothetical protein [Fibrobacter sp.]
MDNKLFAFLFLLASSFFMFGCGSDGSEKLTPNLPSKNTQAVQAPITVPKFTAPQTSAVNVNKAKQYVNASAALLLLGEEWSEKIEKAQGEEKVIILENYEKARDQVCSRVGLAGIAEYNWITNVAVKDSSNAEAFAAAGLKL